MKKNAQGKPKNRPVAKGVSEKPSPKPLNNPDGQVEVMTGLGIVKPHKL